MGRIFLLQNNKCAIPRNKEPWYVGAQCLSHVTAADVGHALQSQVHVDGIAAAQIVLDGLDHQLHQVTAGSDQHGNEQVALEVAK